PRPTSRGAVVRAATAAVRARHRSARQDQSQTAATAAGVSVQRAHLGHTAPPAYRPPRRLTLLAPVRSTRRPPHPYTVTPAVAGRSSSSTNRSQSRTAENTGRSEEHTSELQSRENLVCRLLLEKKKEHNPEPTDSNRQL